MLALVVAVKPVEQTHCAEDVTIDDGAKRPLVGEKIFKTMCNVEVQWPEKSEGKEFAPRYCLNL